MSWGGKGGSAKGPYDGYGKGGGGGGYGKDAGAIGGSFDAGYGKGGGGGYGKADGGKGGKDGGWGKDAGGYGKDKGYGKDQGYGKDKGYDKGGYGKGWGKDDGKGWGKDAGKGGWGGGGKGGGIKGSGPDGDWMEGCTGWVKDWNEERGFGFVTVSDTDIYCHRTTLTDGQALSKDAEVWIEAQWNWEKNKWQSTRVAGAGGKGGDKGKGKGGKGKRGADWMSQVPCKVKTWNEERGFGFATTDAGEDIYAHRTTLQDGSVLPEQGNILVDAQWNWEKGKWHATKVTGATGELQRSATAGIVEPISMGLQGGMVKTWNPKGFGFLVPDNGGADVFCHATAVKPDPTNGLTIGHAVEFDLQYDDKKGKYLAVTCQDMGVMSPNADKLKAASAHAANGADGAN